MNLTLFHSVGCSLIVNNKLVDADSGEEPFSVTVAEAYLDLRSSVQATPGLIAKEHEIASEINAGSRLTASSR